MTKPQLPPDYRYGECYTLPDGDCIGVGCMHNPAPMSDEDAFDAAYRAVPHLDTFSPVERTVIRHWMRVGWDARCG